MATPPEYTILRQVLPVSTISSNLAAGICRFPPVEFLSSPSLPVRSTASETALSFLLGFLSSLLYRNGARLLHLFSSLASLPYVPLLSMEPILRPGAVFFLEWPTWARLAIVLGGLLVILSVIAVCVKMRSWRKNNQFEKRAAEARAERGEMTLAGRTSDDIPFGIRALAEDPDVEGVWNSRTHTPLHCHTPQPGHSVASLRPAGQPKRDPSASSIEQAATTYNELKSPNELEPLANSIAGLNGASTPRTRSKKFVINYQGPYSRSEAAEFDPGRNSNTTEPRLSISPSKMYLRPITDRPPINGRKFVIGHGRKTIYGPHRREAQSEVNPLERMEAHRRFHAAESGQLLPRSRRRHTDLVLTTPLAPSASDSEDSDSSSQYMSWPRGTANINLGKQLSRMAERTEGPKPVPFRAFVESLPTTKPPPSAWTGKTQARVDAKLPASSKGSDTASKVSTHTPKSSISSTTTAPTSPTDSVSIANTRTRKINDGFEVLPAGTLEKGPNVKEFGLWPENQSVSKKPKKLQKRSRSSSGSRRSSMESRRFSGESFRLPIF